MKKILLTTICLAFATFSFSQQLSRYVVSSGGNYSVNGGYSNSSTIGESMVTTLTSASNSLTQGFQQSSCVYGCIDTTACNYDASATCDDGSCIYMGATSTQVNCWDVFTWNATTCQWDTSGSQPSQPTQVNCWETAVFDTITCAWIVTGTQPVQPSLACYESATFDTVTCAWIVTGSQPVQPSLACYESATFDTVTCAWIVTGNPVLAEISQLGENLSASTNPPGLNADWYNTQENGTRIWLMEEDAATFSPTFDCSYFIVVSHEGCVDTSETYFYGANAARIGSFTTSPNPTSGLINVKFENSKNQFVMFELLSNNGSKLDEFITIENNLDIDLSNYPSGSYYLYFNSEDAVQGCRLEEVQKVSTKIILIK